MRRVIIFGVLAALVAWRLLAALQAPPADMPDHVAEKLNSHKPGVRCQGIVAIAENRSPWALDALVEALDDDDSQVRRFALEAIARWGIEADLTVPTIVPLLNDDNNSVRAQAFKTLAALGEASTPHLVEALSDPKRRTDAWQALAQIGPRTIPALTDVLHASDVEARLGAVSALEAIGSPAVGALSIAIDDPDAKVRTHAAVLLRHMRPLPIEVAPALKRRCDDPDCFARVHIAAALATIDKSQRHSAAKVIAAVVSGPNDSSRVLAIEQIVAAGDAAVPSLIAALNDSNAEVRDSACRGLRELGPLAKDAVPELVARLDGESNLDSFLVLEALSGIGPNAAAAGPKLIEIIKRDPENGAVMATLASIRADPETVVPLLVERLNVVDAPARSAAVKALREYGPLAVASVPTLLRLLQDSDYWIRRTAVEAIAKLHVNSPEVVVALSKTLSDPELGIPEIAADALGAMGPEARAAVPELLSMMARTMYESRTAAIRALGRIGAKEAMAPLVQILDDAQAHTAVDNALAAEAIIRIEPSEAHKRIETIRYYALSDEDPIAQLVAIRVWAQLDSSAARVALPALALALKSDDSAMRFAAVEALGAYGPNAADLLEELKKLNDDPSTDVRKAVLAATKAIAAANPTVVQPSPVVSP